MITHEIPHIFRVQKRWNRENRPILTTLNLRSKSPRFCGHPFIRISRVMQFPDYKDPGPFLSDLALQKHTKAYTYDREISCSYMLLFYYPF